MPIPNAVSTRDLRTDRLARLVPLERMMRPDSPTNSASLRILASLGRLALIACAAVPLLATATTEPTTVVAVSAAAALAIMIGVLRWAPGLQDDEARPVATAVLVLVMFVATELFIVSWAREGSMAVLLGPLATAGVVAGYLATFGFRSTFLLRRLTLLSMLLWAPVAAAAERVVSASIDPLSDLIYRRLASIDLFGVSERPWRVFSAMTDRAALVAIGAVVIGAAMSRRRLSARAAAEMAVAVTAALVVHHATILASPIERYERPWWLIFVAGPIYEVLLGVTAAMAAAWVAKRTVARDGRGQNPSVSAAPDRDPVLFAVSADDEAPLAVRLCAVVVPMLLIAVLVGRAVAS